MSGFTGPGFTLFPATVIAADTNTASFSPEKFGQFYAVVTLASVGASQTVTLELQALLPDGTTWVALDIAAAALTTAGTYIYNFGTGGDVSQHVGSGIHEAHPVGLPAVCRFKLDVFNVANVTVTVHILPVG